MATIISRAQIGDNDYSPVVNILTWILLVAMVLSVCSKVAIKVITCRTFNMDDAVLVLAMIMSAGQSIATSIQVFNGDGRHLNTLTMSQVQKYEKAGYSSDLLFIATISISKISVLILLLQISPVTLHRRLAASLGGFIVIWGVSTLLASAFQCRLPRAWEIVGESCFDQTSFWTAYGVVNILTEVGLTGLPIFAIWKVHITMNKKLVVISCFALRLTIIGAVIAQLDLLSKLRNSKDVTFDSWPYHTSTQFAQNLSVITVCIPYVRNVLVGLESGLLQTGAFHLHKLSATTAENTRSHPSATSKGTENKGPVGRLEDTDSLGILRRDASDVGPFHSNNTAIIGANTPTEEWDAESQSSRANIIEQTTEWTVERE